MQNLVRREVIDAARTLVIKVGTNVLSREDDSLDRDRIHSLCDQRRPSLGSAEVGQSGRGFMVLSVIVRIS